MSGSVLILSDLSQLVRAGGLRGGDGHHRGVCLRTDDVQLCLPRHRQLKQHLSPLRSEGATAAVFMD